MLKSKHKINSSWLASIYLVLLHAIAILAMVITSLTSYSKLLLLALIICNLVYNLRRYAWHLQPGSIVEFSHLDKKLWQIKNNHGEVFTCQLKGSSVVSRHIVLLNFQRLDQRWSQLSLILLPDMQSHISFRNLRAYLWTMLRV